MKIIFYAAIFSAIGVMQASEFHFKKTSSGFKPITGIQWTRLNLESSWLAAGSDGVVEFIRSNSAVFTNPTFRIAIMAELDAAAKKYEAKTSDYAFRAAISGALTGVAGLVGWMSYRGFSTGVSRVAQGASGLQTNARLILGTFGMGFAGKFVPALAFASWASYKKYARSPGRVKALYEIRQQLWAGRQEQS